MFPPDSDGKNLNSHQGGGETEIGKVSANEVDIRRKDLLPVYDNFHSVYTSMRNRYVTSLTASHLINCVCQ